jgi:hypothetical protein
LAIKRNEREYAVDPLFHKRSAIFDSGGAKGLLLNVLSSHNGYQLVFDASDLVDDSVEPISHAVGGEVEFELRKMLSSLLPPSWQDAEICPEYAERKKGSSVALQLLLASEPEPMDDDYVINDGHDFANVSIAPISTKAKEGDESSSDDEVDFGGPIIAQSTSIDIDHAPAPAWSYDGHDRDTYDPREEEPMVFGESSLLDARLQRIEQREMETENMAQPEMEYYEVADGPNAEYTYFNRDKLANWTGPEHWKHKSIKPNKKTAQDDEEYQDEEGNIIKTTSKSKGPRKQFRIDFNAPAPANLDELLTSAGTLHCNT